MSKKLAFAAIMLCATAAQAQNWTQSRVGPYTHYQSDDGWTGTSSRVGPYTTYQFNGPNGQTKICRQSTVGPYTHTNCD